MNPSARHSASAICRPTARGVSETRPFVFLKIHTVSEKNTTTVCAFQSSVIIRLTEKRLNNRRRRTTYTDADRNTRKIIDIQGGDAKKKTPPFFPLSDGGRKRCIYIERNLCRCCVIAAWSSSRNGSETGLFPFPWQHHTAQSPAHPHNRFSDGRKDGKATVPENVTVGESFVRTVFRGRPTHGRPLRWLTIKKRRRTVCRH